MFNRPQEGSKGLCRRLWMIQILQMWKGNVFPLGGLLLVSTVGKCSPPPGCPNPDPSHFTETLLHLDFFLPGGLRWRQLGWFLELYQPWNNNLQVLLIVEKFHRWFTGRKLVGSAISGVRWMVHCISSLVKSITTLYTR